MGTEAAGWADKAMEAWAKYRADFEAYIPDADKNTPEEIAQIREHRRQFMDYVEKNYAGLPDSELMGMARGLWFGHGWLGDGINSHDVSHYHAVHCVLVSRGYDIGELHKKWRAEAVGQVKAHVDALVSGGAPLEGLARAVVAQQTDKETGEVDWAGVDYGLAMYLHIYDEAISHQGSS